MAVPDCVIAGAGPTGLTLALELVRRGKSVRIFDRSPGTRPLGQSRALGILPPTLTILKESGVTETLLEAGLKIQRMLIVANGKQLAELELKHGGGEFPFLLSLQQASTERILEAALVKLGVNVEWGTQAVDIDNSGENPVLVVERHGRQERIEGRHLAGCDGVRSIVRSKLGIAFDGDIVETPFSLADVTLVNPPSTGCGQMELHPNGVIVSIPMPENTYRLIGTKPGVHLRPEVASKIADLFWESDFQITFRHVKQLQKGRVFLAGDAAHVHSPAGGRGMNTGIADAAWLAWLICEERTAEYEAMRLPVAEHIIDYTRSLTRMAVADRKIIQILRRWALPLVLRFDFVQRRAAANLMAHDMPHPPWIENERP